jgi:CheY-like chemotaxis protein
MTEAAPRLLEADTEPGELGDRSLHRCTEGVVGREQPACAIERGAGPRLARVRRQASDRRPCPRDVTRAHLRLREVGPDHPRVVGGLADLQVDARQGASRLLAVAARERRPGLPVVFVSGYTGDTTVAGSDDPATAFLAKPFDGDDLLRAVRTTIDATRKRVP